MLKARSLQRGEGGFRRRLLHRRFGIRLRQRARGPAFVAGAGAVHRGHRGEIDVEVLHATGVVAVGALGGVGHVDARRAGRRLARSALVAVQRFDLLRGPD